jgi:hypothetical protein
MHTMKKIKGTALAVSFVALMTLASAGVASAQIKGCTSDIRTGVCNKNCSVSNVGGCTADQVGALLKIHHMDCISKATNTEFDRINKGGSDKGEFEKSKAACTAEVDKAIADWKAAQNNNNKKKKR